MQNVFLTNENKPFLILTHTKQRFSTVSYSDLQTAADTWSIITTVHLRKITTTSASYNHERIHLPVMRDCPNQLHVYLEEVDELKFCQTRRKQNQPDFDLLQ